MINSFFSKPKYFGLNLVELNFLLLYCLDVQTQFPVGILITPFFLKCPLHFNSNKMLLWPTLTVKAERGEGKAVCLFKNRFFKVHKSVLD